MRLRVGLTGGIGSGKTVVGARFAQRGALLIDADRLARDAVAPGGEAFRRIVERWPQALTADGGLDRAALARIVFADPTERAALNAIVHPLVRASGRRLESEAAPNQIVVQEVPLLFETGFERRCDATVLVVADPQTRIARVAARSGLSPGEVERRMSAQIEPAIARERATFTIENDGTLADLNAAADRVWDRLLAIPPSAGRTPPAKPPGSAEI